MEINEILAIEGVGSLEIIKISKGYRCEICDEDRNLIAIGLDNEAEKASDKAVENLKDYLKDQENFIEPTLSSYERN